MESWNGGMENELALFFKIELAAMCLGLLSHCRGYMSKSSVASDLPCLVL